MLSNESEKLRCEAAELQALARHLMEQAEKLITTSKELEKKIDGRGPKKRSSIEGVNLIEGEPKWKESIRSRTN